MHSIRLAGPWELQLPGSAAQRMEFPVTWRSLLALASDSLLPSPTRLVRRFGQPTGIEPSDRLEIVIESTVDARVELNGQALGQLAASRPTSSFEVTSLLTARNELAVVIEMPGANSDTEDALLTNVRLEIS